MYAITLKSGNIALPSLNLSWPDLTFRGNQISIFSGSPNAPISDLFFFLAGLQQARRFTRPAEKGKLIREEVCVPKETLLKVVHFEVPIYETPELERAKRVGFIFNDPELSLVGSTAREDIDHAFAAVGQPQPNSKVCKKYGFTLEKLLRRVDVLSGGELHRLLCLIAIERMPEILFVDLTRSNLDDDFLDELCKHLMNIADSGCCILTSGISPERFREKVEKYQVDDFGQVSEALNSEEISLNDQKERLKGLLTARKMILDKKVLAAMGICRTGITAPVSFDVHAGEIVVVYGPNGCGKTTLGLIVAGRCKESEYDGKPRVAKEVKPVMALQHAARSFVEDSLLAELPDPEYWESLGFDRRQIVCHPREIGYGMQKLAACALALNRSKGLCILDEPTCGMNFAVRQKFVELLNRYPDTSVLIFTHDSTLRLIGRVLNYGEMSL